MKSSTALAYDARCLAHDNGSMLFEARARTWLDVAHAESPERVQRAHRLLEASGVIAQLESLAVPLGDPHDIGRVHTAAHIDAIHAACAQGVHQTVGPEARVGPASWEPALLAVGATTAAVDWALERPGGRAYALVRPPGHHASSAQAMGFCLFNNVAIAARRAQDEHGARRVAIVDWDVHHGNGTQDVFYDDADVLFVSLHQDDLYPRGRGGLTERGAGAGDGATVNVPLPAGSGDAGYLAACERVVVPALRRFRPELILVSSGQDAAASDPLGRMSVTAEGFRGMMRLMVGAAEELCQGRVVAVQEGGYSIDHMPFCVLATVEALAGLEPSFAADPMELDIPDGLGAAEQRAVDEAGRAARRPPARSRREPRGGTGPS